MQRDPLGADGYLFFRGWFNLLLSVYKYVSDDGKWERPFMVTGYGDEQLEWTHSRIADALERQYRQHPEGPHCENTKIWFYCNNAAGLGPYLYDRLHNADHRGRETRSSRRRRIELSVLRSVTSQREPRGATSVPGGNAHPS